MNVVDNQRMGVLQTASGPDSVAHMRVIRRQVFVQVLDDFRIVGWPKHGASVAPRAVRNKPRSLAVPCSREQSFGFCGD